MFIRWHGHSCFEIGDDIKIVTDPHDGRSIGIHPPTVRADIVFVSHRHFDHSSVRTVKGPRTKIIDKPGKFKVYDVEGEGIKSYHDDVNGKKRGDNIIFKFKFKNVVFCHMGDQGCIPEKEIISKIKGVDILFIPVGNVFTISPQVAWKIINIIEPRVAVPMHYRIAGLSLSIKPVKNFIEISEKESEVIHVGNEIELEINDLPDTLNIWVFSM